MQVLPGSPPRWLCISRLLTDASTLWQVLRPSASHSRQPTRTLFICRHGERMDVVFGKHWPSLCSDSQGQTAPFN